MAGALNEAPREGAHSSSSPFLQTLVGVGTTLLGAVLAVGASSVSSEAGYGGVGPNFLPWVVSVVLLVCGVLCVVQARTGGFRNLEEGSGDVRGHWPGFVWVSAGLLLNAWLITELGFIVSCALCFMLAVRGFKSAEGRSGWGLVTWLVDFLLGVAVAAPVFWMFTQVLAINLPGLTKTGWL